ncbi:MAG: AAA family ATPase [Symploca sp. SIO2D2]|nr:AAA family ATPase [Symploca sp. SIO2D2]
MTTATVRRNPYIVGSAIADPKAFFGRSKLFQFVEDNLTQSERVILLHGQRRIGKSSVLLQIPNFVASEQFVFIPFDLQNKGKLALSKVLHLLAEAIIKHLNLKLDAAQLPKESDFATEPSIFSQKFLPEIYRLLGQKNIVMMLDEFDALNNYEPTSSVATFFPYLQSLLSQHEKLFIIPVIGRQPDDLPKLLSLFKGAPTQKIGLLSREDTEKLIIDPAKDALEYTQDAIEAIVALSQGHPYFTQLLCYAVFAQARAEQKQQVIPEDVERVVDEAIEIGEAGLAWFRDGLPIPERVIFSAVAEAQKRAKLRDYPFIEDPLAILREYGVVPTESLRQAKIRLVEWDFLDLAKSSDLLSEATRAYRMKVELVRRWLVKQHPLKREIWELEKLTPAAHIPYQSATELESYELLKNAIPLYEQALSINPNYFSALFKLAEGYLEIRDFSKAVEFYKRAYRLDSSRVQEDYVELLQSYGLELMEQRKFELAKEQFSTISLIQPNNFLAQDKLEEIETYRARFNLSKLDPRRFFMALNPARAINAGNDEEYRYYIDFSPVRGNQLESFLRTITYFSPDEPTCQLFTGNIGCGKTTELLRLKAELEEQGFHTVYFPSSQEIDMADVDVIDILLLIARQISENLEKAGIGLREGGYFKRLLAETVDLLQSQINITAESSTIDIGNIFTEVKDSNTLRSKLRQYLEPRTSSLLAAINSEIIQPAIEKLKQIGKEGLVVIVDNLDRLYDKPKASGRNPSEYLFIDHAEHLKQLSCHVVYTIPLSLTFSKEFGKLRNYFGVAPEVLSMVPIRLKDDSECHEGMELMRQMVLARAFPHVSPDERLNLISEIFDSIETLDRLCAISGGHLRNLLSIISSCLIEEDLPLSRTCLERLIKKYRNELILAISDDEWELLSKVAEQKNILGQQEYQTLFWSSFVFDYQYEGDRWFDLNPVLAEELVERNT